jgi:predicted hotdog family 3-hydroxylacyl-ACP dehydratase
MSLLDTVIEWDATIRCTAVSHHRRQPAARRAGRAAAASNTPPRPWPQRRLLAGIR